MIQKQCARCGKDFNTKRRDRVFNCPYCAHRTAKTLSERFWERVQKGEQCWVWTGANFGRGRYGAILNLNGGKRYLLAHRVSWELHNGPIPDGKYICHRCDNPICVNPSHLFLGDALSNMRDKIAKGRAVYKSKLTEAQVREIKTLKCIPAKEVATRFNTTSGNVYKIWSGMTWRHVM